MPTIEINRAPIMTLWGALPEVRQARGGPPLQTGCYLT